ncbi:hypothetical protein AXK11_02630 [Cephaloticoccus primus]|uniref:Glycosyl hydrolase family 13 catalytic domain-containing protein n=1 Tax=Cephaloticoccus primus TaxID=1548207 RepID=A0A139SS37_9BACT|nr:alpha-amylase family glycosyl hydrolase [Cephaloticoccus primus]KXU37357.1 hypothetical protein AXK11_02630 [Cephaloticoccus primus]
MTSHNPLIRAWLTSLKGGVIEYARDWEEIYVPALRLRPGGAPSGGAGVSEGAVTQIQSPPSPPAAEPEVPAFAKLEPAPRYVAARRYGYFVREDGALVFALVREVAAAAAGVDAEQLYVAGDFNGWEGAAGDPAWELKPFQIEGDTAPRAPRQLFCCVLPLAQRRSLMSAWPRAQFKFVTSQNQWLNVPEDSPNRVKDALGHINYVIDSTRTGRQFFRFELRAPLDLSQEWCIAPLAGAPAPATHAPQGQPVSSRLPSAARAEPQSAALAKKEAQAGPGRAAAVLGEALGVPIQPGAFFFSIASELPLGALVSADGRETCFRLFAPRAAGVRLLLAKTPDAAAPAEVVSLARHATEAGIWETTVEGNLHGRYYWYQLEVLAERSAAVPAAAPGAASGGEGAAATERARTARVLDPYALACVGHAGPGIVIDRARINRHANPAIARWPDRFATPQWQDLVIAEAHVRDLAARAPIELSAEERLGFTGLRKWVESEGFYLHRLGVNCVELQPVQEFDNRSREEYHWGYMPVNWFAPASAYALEPERASGIAELQALVAAFHRRGIAVILDVVYNHQGEPAGLISIDRQYYFELDAEGQLSNWSGCGNDLRAHAAMAKRLIIDSCRHFIECYGVDGFRFDLAELLGIEVLRDIEAALKRAKPDVILIAEPWSYRGHIAGALRDTGWSSWNDGYRNFIRDYVCGGSSAEALEYFIKGSPWFWSKFPAQTVNYSESHDDRAWVDSITENAHHDGSTPTATDRRRTHLMAALLFASLGIPMIAAGQDFLRSKHGVNNTYQRGDLNALDYRRLLRYPSTHTYFADWIAFRRSAAGRLLRQWQRPGEGFFRCYRTPDSTACAVVYNFDASQGRQRLLFAINPTGADVEIPLGEALPTVTSWQQIANHEGFLSANGMRQPVTSQLWLPALSCGLWQGSL